MKTILCYGDSNLRGFIPGSYDVQTGLSKRYPKQKRWTGVLQNALGIEWTVVEEGLNGRTTSLDEITPGRSFRNGLTSLPLFLETHFPIELVILMLGTNDCKTQFQKSAKEIAEGMRKVIKLLKISDRGPNGTAPKILLIASPPLLDSIESGDPDFGKRSVEESKKLPAFYSQLAKVEKCDFLDASLYIQCSEIDGVHFDEEQVRILGNTVTKKVKEIIHSQAPF